MSIFFKKIWERYLFKECCKAFFFFLFGFYFLYVVIDYSIHLQEFIQGNIRSLWKIIYYYLLQFIKRADILFPLSFLLSSIQTLCRLNQHKELVAFQSAGISKKRLLRPFLLLAIFCSFSTLFLNEFAIPFSLNTIDRFYDEFLRHSYRGTRSELFYTVHLEDHSKIIYQYYNPKNDAFFDVIWIRDGNDLWKMKYLKGIPEQPQGFWVDHLTRNEQGYLEKKESYPNYLFTELLWNQNIPKKGFIPFENRSIRELIRFLHTDSLLSNFEKQELLTQLLFKWTMPFCSLLVLMGAAPFCMENKKNLQMFFIYIFGLFGFIAFVAFMDAAVILGENNTISPYVAILFPFAILSLFFGWRFAHLK